MTPLSPQPASYVLKLLLRENKINSNIKNTKQIVTEKNSKTDHCLSMPHDRINNLIDDADWAADADKSRPIRDSVSLERWYCMPVIAWRTQFRRLVCRLRYIGLSAGSCVLYRYDKKFTTWQAQRPIERTDCNILYDLRRLYIYIYIYIYINSCGDGHSWSVSLFEKPNCRENRICDRCMMSCIAKWMQTDVYQPICNICIMRTATLIYYALDVRHHSRHLCICMYFIIIIIRSLYGILKCRSHNDVVSYIKCISVTRLFSGN